VSVSPVVGPLGVVGVETVWGVDIVTASADEGLETMVVVTEQRASALTE